MPAEREDLLVESRAQWRAWPASTPTRATGSTRPSGRAVVAAAVADGSWRALDAVEALEEPPEPAAALDADPRASWPRAGSRRTSGDRRRGGG